MWCIQLNKLYLLQSSLVVIMWVLSEWDHEEKIISDTEESQQIGDNNDDSSIVDDRIREDVLDPLVERNSTDEPSKESNDCLWTHAYLLGH